MGDFGAVDGHEHVSNKAIFGLVPSIILSLIAAFLPSAACAEDASAHEFLMRESGRADIAAPLSHAPAASTLAAPHGSDARARARRAARIAAHRAQEAQAKATIAKAIDTASARPGIVGPEAKMAALVSRFGDETLRKGDIVATQAGLMIFLGASHFPYKPSDFAPFAVAAKKKTQDLAAVDRALGGGRPSIRKPQLQASAGVKAKRSDGRAGPLAYARSEHKLDVEKVFAVALKTKAPQAANAPESPARRLRIVGAGYIY